MSVSKLDEVLGQLGVVPAAFYEAVDAAYAHQRRQRAMVDLVAEYSVRTIRSTIHDHTWGLVRRLLSEMPDAEFIEDSGTEILRYKDRFCFQLHKIDDALKARYNDTQRPREIEWQQRLWQGQADGHCGDVWLTIGHQPDDVAMTVKAIYVGVAVEGGMSQMRMIVPDSDAVASIGPIARATVESLRKASGM